ncbi:hypothetical protein NDU88_000381 [Pleurodeles waltl]|uniref:Uncharacterized protein n=1 Tax=Pleurodeles waltl TaxID=8319 RepID=A0AAV7WJJ9_PLEWA|nr:hypothetical protein NDU88_000381 [Pleurodeles waltl]
MQRGSVAVSSQGSRLGAVPGRSTPASTSNGLPVPPQSHQCPEGLTRVYCPLLFRYFSVCQGPGLHLQSSGPAACPLVAPPPQRRAAPSPSRTRAGPYPLWGTTFAQGQHRSAFRRGLSLIGPLGPNRHLRRSGETRLESPAVLGPAAPEPPRSAAQREASISFAGRPLHFQGAARLQKRRFAAPRLGASLLGLPGPHWHLRGRGETRPESPAVLGPIALTLHRVAAPRKAPAARPGPRPLNSPTGRFHPPAPSGVATGVRSRPATSVGSAPLLGP